MVNQEFIIDGVRSIDIGIEGLSIVRTDSGLSPTPFLGGSQIVETKVPKVQTPYFHYLQRKPLEFTLKFSLLDKEFDKDRRYEIAKLFMGNKYKEFISIDDITKVYYVICTNQSDLMTNGIDQGYFEVNFRCQHPYALTPIYMQEFEVNNETITLDNKSNIGEDYYFPEIEVELLNNTTSFSLTNYSDGGRVINFSGLNSNEILYLNNATKKIKSSTGLYRFSKWNKNSLRLVYGQNQVLCTGNFKLTVKCQFPIFS